MAIKIRHEKLKEIAKSRKVSMNELSKILGISSAYISRIFNENYPVGSKLIECLLKETGYQFEELFYFEHKSTKQ